MSEKLFRAFEYDFNDGSGRIVYRRDGEEPTEGQQVVLYYHPDNKSDPDDEGFAAVVTVTGMRDAYDPNYLVLHTDLAEGRA